MWHHNLKKFKFKSSTSLVVLLFVLNAALAVPAVIADTIIVDGKNVIVETRVVTKPIEKAAPGNHSLSGIPLFTGLIGFQNTGLNMVSSSLGGFQTIEEMVGYGPRLSTGYGLAIQAGGKAGKRFNFSVKAGYAAHSLRHIVFDTGLLHADSLRLGFQSTAKGKLDEVTRIFIDPGYETDTFSLELNSSKIQLRQPYAGIEVEFMAGRAMAKNYWIIAAELSFVFQSVGRINELLLVQSSGNWKSLGPANMSFNRTLPLTAIHIGRCWNRGGSSGWQARAGLYSPMGNLNQSEALRWQQVGLQLSLLWRYELVRRGN